MNSRAVRYDQILRAIPGSFFGAVVRRQMCGQLNLPAKFSRAELTQKHFEFGVVAALDVVLQTLAVTCLEVAFRAHKLLFKLALA